MVFMEEKDFITSVPHEKVVVNNSKVHGKGLFAVSDIEKNTTLHVTHVHKELVDYTGVSSSWINLTPNNQYNHSKERENCKIVTDGLTKGLVTLRNIIAGEELLVDYTKDLELEQPEPGWKT